jgi:hypothetical protein
LSSDRCRRIAFASDVATRCFEVSAKVNGVEFNELSFAFELSHDWSNFDFDSAFKDIAMNFMEFSTGQTRSDALEVGENNPRFGDGLVDGESVV